MGEFSNIICPAPLQKGDKIAIVSPAGAVNPDFVYREAQILNEQGWEVEIAPHALGRHLNYSGTVEERLSDMTDALLDSSVKAVFCSRGGYGAVQLIGHMANLPLRKYAKWIAGYSDISALHALMASRGIVSLHAPMARHISESSGSDRDSAMMFSVLEGVSPSFSFESCPMNRRGIARGKIVGGNLAVLSALIATPYDIFTPGVILFIEDIGEPVYKVERIFYQLKMSGRLEKLAGLIVGQFTEYKIVAGAPSMYETILNMVGSYGFPVAFGAPIGHVPHNIPIPVSSTAILEVEADFVNLSCSLPIKTK